jgi:hypothetical protein
LESLLEDELEKERERMRVVEAEVQDFQDQIEELEAQLESQTEEERAAAFEEALRQYENSWIDGFYSSPSNADDYYDSPYWDLELANLNLLERQRELEITVSFPNILRKSFFVNLYSFLESTLKQKCHDLERQGGQLLLLKEIAGRGIQRAMVYLIKVQGIPLSLGESSHWERIQNYRRLRNCIVHNEGKLDERAPARAQLEAFVDREPGLYLSGDEIVLSADFCSKAIDTVEGFLVQVFLATRNS